MTSQAAQATWTMVCRLDDLEPEWGESALLDDQQLALFRLWDDRVMITSNLDPRTGSAVMARGIVGSRGGTPTIASPLHKESYSLLTGECFGNSDLRLEVFAARVHEGTVWARTPLPGPELSDPEQLLEHGFSDERTERVVGAAL